MIIFWFKLYESKMSTYTQIIYQIVIGTKHHSKVLYKENRPILFKYISGLFDHKKCKLFCINGTENHIHIITHLHPLIALADLVKDLKISTNIFIRDKKLFPQFNGWQLGYGAFTYSQSALGNLIKYVQNQEQHHLEISFIDEYITLLNENGIEFKEKFII